MKAGYIQVDNCIIEDSLVLIQNPGSGHFRFCTFRHANVIMQHVNVSVLENCEFSQCDLAAISVEGFPKDEVNWAHGHMTYITTVVKETICKDSGDDIRSRSSLSARTKSSVSPKMKHANVAFLRTGSPGAVVNDDGLSVSSSTVNSNVRRWINNLVETGSQVSLTTDFLAGQPHSHPQSAVDLSESLSNHDMVKSAEKCNWASCSQIMKNKKMNQQLYAGEKCLSPRSNCVNCRTERIDQSLELCSKTGQDTAGIFNNTAAKNDPPDLTSLEQDRLCCNSSGNETLGNVRDSCSDLIAVDSSHFCQTKSDLTAAKVSGPNHAHAQGSSSQSHSSSESKRTHSFGSRLHRTARLASSASDSATQDKSLVPQGLSDGEDGLSLASSPGLDGALTVNGDPDQPCTSSSWPGGNAPQGRGQGRACDQSQSQAQSKPIKETVTVDIHRPTDHLVGNGALNVADKDCLNASMIQARRGVQGEPVAGSGNFVNESPEGQLGNARLNSGPVDRSAGAAIENLDDPADAEFLLDDLSSGGSSGDRERGAV